MAAGKKAGRHSQQANDFLEPKAPIEVSATNVGSGRAYNNGRIDVTFTHDSSGPAATSYTASAYCSVHGETHTATGSSSPLTITGFGSGITTTVTVVATNAVGNSPASAPSSSVTVTTVPATPSAPSASAQGSAATDDVSWSAPADGGSAITGYSWESNDSKSGSTGSTSVSVSQEAGSSQSYRVRATNANGNSEWSSYSSAITSFSFTPFGFVPFGFVPFGAFGFTPFGAFGFTPFGAFGFTPFGAFGFTPFGAFGFTPFGFTPFGFSPGGCIHGDTLVRTPNGLKPAKEIQVGDIVLAVDLSEIPTAGSEGDFNYINFSSESLTGNGLVEVNVVGITPSTKYSNIAFNGDSTKKYSSTQPFFIKRGSSYQVIISAEIEEGDYLIQVAEDGSLSEILVTSVDVEMVECEVYQFNCEPQDWFIAGDYLVHNK